MTYLLDTNVISELVLKAPSENVLKNFQAHQGTLAIASVVWHELLFGLGRLAESKKKEHLSAFVWKVVYPSIPILAYDSDAARWHAQERARLSRKGLAPAFADGQIASIAVTNGLRLVTRNLSDFENFEDLHIETWH